MRSLAYKAANQQCSRRCRHGPHLDVLQCEVLGVATTVRAKHWFLSSDHCEEVPDCRNETVHVEIDVIAAPNLASIIGSSKPLERTFRSPSPGLSPDLSSLDSSSPFPCNWYGKSDWRTRADQSGGTSSLPVHPSYDERRR